MLKNKGVRFPERYPPANLHPGGSQFRGVMAELETLVLLAEVVDPKLLELAEREDGRDTDIIIRLSPPYRLQVKGPLAANVRTDYTIMKMVRVARTNALNEFRAKHNTPWRGVFSNIKIRSGKKTEVSSGVSYSVDHPRRVHAAVVQIDSGVLAGLASRNLDRWVRGAVSQLSRYTDALLVPVPSFGTPSGVPHLLVPRILS